MVAKGHQSTRNKELLFFLQQHSAVQLHVLHYCLGQPHLRKTFAREKLLRKEGLLETELLVGQTAGHRNQISGLYRMCSSGLDSAHLDYKAEEMTQAKGWGEI